MKRRLKNKLPRHVNYRLAVFQEHDFKNKQTQTNKQTTKIAKENVRKNEKPNNHTKPQTSWQSLKSEEKHSCHCIIAGVLSICLLRSDNCDLNHKILH